jgi:hypothetical protein
MSRPILPWRSPLEFLPLAGKEVWIRRLPWYDRPILANAQTPDGVMVYPSVVPDGTTQLEMQLSWDHVHTWKYRYLADEEEAFPPAE